MKIRANVTIEVKDAHSGEILETRRAKNLVVDSGLNLARDLFTGNGFRPDAIAVGSGTGATAAGTTALGNEAFRKAIDRRAQTNKAVTFQIFLSSSEANGFTLTEVGLFEASTLVARALITPAIVKTGSVEVTLSHEISFEAG